MWSSDCQPRILFGFRRCCAGAHNREALRRLQDGVRLHREAGHDLDDAGGRSGNRATRIFELTATRLSGGDRSRRPAGRRWRPTTSALICPYLGIERPAEGRHDHPPQSRALRAGPVRAVSAAAAARALQPAGQPCGIDRAISAPTPWRAAARSFSRRGSIRPARWRSSRASRVSILMQLPTMFLKMLEARQEHARDLSSLQAVLFFGGPMVRDKIVELRKLARPYSPAGA